MSKNIQMQEKTSSGYDILYPQTIAAQIEDVYSKDETITTATKALYGLGATATPNQVFSAISAALDGKARIQTGSYVGTGTYGASNPCSLTFDINPKFIIIGQKQEVAYYFLTVRDSNAIVIAKEIDGNSNNTYGLANYVTWNKNSITWFNRATSWFQVNSSSTVYNWCAIG